MNFGNIFRYRRARSRTFNGEVKAKELESRPVRSSSDTTVKVRDGVLNPEENRTTFDILEPAVAIQPSNGGGSKPAEISSLGQNVCAIDSAVGRSSQGEIKLQTSNGRGVVQTEISPSAEKKMRAVDFAANQGKFGAGFWNHSAGLCRKSLSTSNLLTSTRKAQYPVDFDLNMSAELLQEEEPCVQKTLFTEVKVEASFETGKTSLPRRAVSIVNETQVHAAIACDDARELCRLLNEQSLDPNETCTNALTLLHRAAAEGRYCCLKVLLSHGADVNACDLDGWTPLHDAVFHGHVRCALALLIAGADVEAETFEFVKPIEMAEDDEMILIIGRAMAVYHNGSLSKPDRETLV